MLVEQLDATKKQVAEQGGKILVPKLTIPNIGDIAVITDNVGAVIGLFESPR